MFLLLTLLLTLHKDFRNCVIVGAYKKTHIATLDAAICHTRHGEILVATFASMHVICQFCVACQLAENGQLMHPASTRIREAARQFLMSRVIVNEKYCDIVCTYLYVAVGSLTPANHAPISLI